MTPDESLPKALLQKLTAAGAPLWYLKAIAQPRTTRFVTTTDGLKLHCTFWNESESDKPPLLLVHGYRAHAHAWDPIAPYFTQNFRVLAVDLIGMGQSDRRADYAYVTRFADDLPAVVEGFGLGSVMLVGHSFGGACAIHFAHRRPDLVKRLVAIDTMVPFPELDQERISMQRGRTEPYPDYDSIISRYRLLPPQPCPAWSEAYMAHHSVRQVAGGWTWKFDTNLPAGRVEFGTQAALRALTMPTDFISGEYSVVCDAQRARLVEQAIGQGRRTIVIPEAYHHILLDHPLSLVGALRALLA